MTALRELRTARGLSLRALGGELGVSGQAVFKWENGDAWPEAPMLPKLAKVLGCSIDDLFREETAAQSDFNMEGTA